MGRREEGRFRLSPQEYRAHIRQCSADGRALHRRRLPWRLREVRRGDEGGNGRNGRHPDPKKVEELCVQYNQKFTGPALAVSLRLVPEPEKAAEFEKELDALQGDWTLVASEGRGETRSPEDIKSIRGSWKSTGIR